MTANVLIQFSGFDLFPYSLRQLLVLTLTLYFNKNTDVLCNLEQQSCFGACGIGYRQQSQDQCIFQRWHKHVFFSSFLKQKTMLSGC